MNTTTGIKIKLLRTLMGMSQSEFADYLNISRPLLSGVESGLRNRNDNVVSKVEEALGIELDDERIERFISINPQIKPDSEVVVA